MINQCAIISQVIYMHKIVSPFRRIVAPYLALLSRGMRLTASCAHYVRLQAVTKNHALRAKIAKAIAFTRRRGRHRLGGDAFLCIWVRGSVPLLLASHISRLTSELEINDMRHEDGATHAQNFDARRFGNHSFQDSVIKEAVAKLLANESLFAKSFKYPVLGEWLSPERHNSPEGRTLR